MNTPASNAAYIWCDIDGHGKRWRLAVWREDTYGDEEIYFPFDDFGTEAHEFANSPLHPISPPIEPPAA